MNSGREFQAVYSNYQDVLSDDFHVICSRYDSNPDMAAACYMEPLCRLLQRMTVTEVQSVGLEFLYCFELCSPAAQEFERWHNDYRGLRTDEIFERVTGLPCILCGRLPVEEIAQLSALIAAGFLDKEQLLSVSDLGSILLPDLWICRNYAVLCGLRYLSGYQAVRRSDIVNLALASLLNNPHNGSGIVPSDNLCSFLQVCYKNRNLTISLYDVLKLKVDFVGELGIMDDYKLDVYSKGNITYVCCTSVFYETVVYNRPLSVPIVGYDPIKTWVCQLLLSVQISYNSFSAVEQVSWLPLVMQEVMSGGISWLLLLQHKISLNVMLYFESGDTAYDVLWKFLTSGEQVWNSMKPVHLQSPVIYIDGDPQSMLTALSDIKTFAARLTAAQTITF